MESREVKRVCDDAERNLGKIKDALRDINNGFERLGQPFRNDARFTRDAPAIRDAVRQLERDLERLKDRVATVKRSNR